MSKKPNIQKVIHSPILFNADKLGLSIRDLAKSIGVSVKTFNQYLNDPLLMRARDYSILAGLLGIPMDALIYLSVRKKPQLSKEDKWYLDGIKGKYELPENRARNVV